MPAPSPAGARPAPTGLRLKDGFSSMVGFAANSNVNMFHMTAKPPGFDGGEPIQTTTMHNKKKRTFAPRHLQTMSPFTFKFAYDPATVTDIQALINIETTLTTWWPNNDTLAYYGFLQKVEFDELEEGKFPTGTATVVPTNTDPSDGTEQDPVFTPATGT